MELYEVIEKYRGVRPKEDEKIDPILEEIVLNLYEGVLGPWVEEAGEIGQFMGKPIISKPESIGTAVTQYILFSYPDEEKMKEIIGFSSTASAEK